MAPLTVSTILAWDPAAIYDVFRIAKDRENTFANFGTNLQRTQNTVADWSGEAGEAFHEAIGRRRADIDADGHESARVAKAVARAEQDVESVQMRMRAVVKYLNDRHIDVGEDGTLKIRPGFEDDPDARKALEQQAKTGNGLTVSEIMADADRVDEELAAAMRAAVGDEQLDENGRPIPGTQHAPAAPLVTPEQLSEIYPTLSKADAERYAGPLSDAMRAAGMTSPQARAAFLATFAVESGELKFWTEKRNESECTRMYGPEYAGVTFPPGTFDGIDGPYTNSSGQLGNTQPGDGYRYRGRGPIQLTGRSNYEAAGQALGVDLVNHPELAANPDVGFKVATWYWNNHKAILPDGSAVPLNQAAESGNFTAVSVAVNGGTIGLPNRLKYFDRALAVLSR